MFKLLACIDLSQYAPSVCDHAAWIATRVGASVELLHVIQRKDALSARHDLSGALGLAAKSTLMEELVTIEEGEAKLAKEQGRRLLTVSEARLRAAGLQSVTALHRHGDIVETIVEREADADLVVIGKRGASANFAKGHLGSKVDASCARASSQCSLPAGPFSRLTASFLPLTGGRAPEKR